MTGILLAAVFLTAATSARIAPTKLEDINNPFLPPAFSPPSSTFDPHPYTHTQYQLTTEEEVPYTEEEVPYTQVNPTPTMEVAPQSASPLTPTFIFEQQFPASLVQEKIVGGEEMPPHEYPSMIGLYYRSKGSSVNQGPICGGTIISDEYVITAGHCVRRSNVDYVIKAGIYSLSNPCPEAVQEVVVEKVFNHPKYGENGIQNDIAVLKLSTPLKKNVFVQPIKLNTNSSCPVTADRCIAAGWGRLRSSQGGPDKPHKVEVPIEDQAKCKQIWGSAIGGGSVCIGVPPPGYKGVCNGDSGGPLFCQCDGELTLVGATSFGTRDCAQPNYPQVFTRVSYYDDFIEQCMNNGGGGPGDSTTPPC